MAGGTRGAEIVRWSGRNITVRALTYNTPDSYSTSWAPGCLSDGLRQQLPVVCWAHDRKRIVGRVTGYRDTSDGLDFDILLADPADVPDARMVQSLLADDMIPGVSIGFDRATAPEPDPLHRGVLRFRSARCVELSFVAVPSVPGARVLALRAADLDFIDDEFLVEIGDELAHEFRAAEALEDDAEAAIARLRCIELAAGGRAAPSGGTRSVLTRRRPTRKLEPLALADPTPREFFEPMRPPSPMPLPSVPPAPADPLFMGAEHWPVDEPMRPASAPPDQEPPAWVFEGKPDGWTDQQAHDAWKRRSR